MQTIVNKFIKWENIELFKSDSLNLNERKQTTVN
jgi:hypothetical protein